MDVVVTTLFTFGSATTAGVVLVVPEEVVTAIVSVVVLFVVELAVGATYPVHLGLDCGFAVQA